MTIVLSDRLSLVASFCIPNLPTVDVGTDHAYLPVYLVQSGILSECISSDVADDPLKNARHTLEKYSLSDKIKLVKSDGLKEIDSPFSQVIICGMGGTLIRQILSAEPRIKQKNMHLILQPMTRVEDVREFLWKNGFEIRREQTVLDESRVYVVLDAFYTGRNTEHSEYDTYVGLILPNKKNKTQNDIRHLEKQNKIFDAKERGEQLRNTR